MNTKTENKTCPGCLENIADNGKTVVIPCQVPNEAGELQKTSVKTSFCFDCAELYKLLPAANRRKVRERFNRNLLRDLAHNTVRLVALPQRKTAASLPRF